MCGKLSGSSEWRIMKGIPPKIVKLIGAFDEVYDWLYAHTKEIMQGIESKWK